MYRFGLLKFRGLEIRRWGTCDQGWTDDGLWHNPATKPINAILSAGQSLLEVASYGQGWHIAAGPNHIRQVLEKIHPALWADSQWLIICGKLPMPLEAHFRMANVPFYGKGCSVTDVTWLWKVCIDTFTDHPIHFDRPQTCHRVHMHTLNTTKATKNRLP